MGKPGEVTIIPEESRSQPGTLIGVGPGLQGFAVAAPTARHAVVDLDQLTVLLCLEAQVHPASISLNRGRVEATTPDTGRGAIKAEVLTVTALFGKADFVKAAARGRDRPQLTLETVNLAGVVCEHPARGSLLDG
jgi:hypothetical protein